VGRIIIWERQALKSFNYRRDPELNVLFTRFNTEVNPSCTPEELVAGIVERQRVEETKK